MKKLSALLSVVILLSACVSHSGSGVIVSRSFPVSGFHGISAQQGFEVDIHNGSSTSVEIEADDNLMKYVKAEVQDGILKLSIDKNNLNNVTLKAHIMASQLDKISASSAADIQMEDAFTSDGVVHIGASSGSSITANFVAPEVEAEVSSGSKITLSGKTRSFTAGVSSGASLNAFEMMSENTTVTSSSGSTAKVHSSVMLKASASSGGSVQYRGNPTTNNSQSSGGGISKVD